MAADKTVVAPGSAEGGDDPETAELAIRYLQSQLDMATAAYDNLDRKATLLPPFIAGAAGLLLGTGHITLVQAVLLVPALVTGAAAGWFAIEALKTRPLASGPEPTDVAKKMGRPLREFSPALAGVIAEAIDARRTALSGKAKMFNRALRLAGVTLLLVASARLLGGLAVTDQPADTTPTASPAATPSVQPSGMPSATPAVTPALTPAATDAGSPGSSDAGSEPMFGMAFESKGQLGEPPMFGMATEQRSAAEQPAIEKIAVRDVSKSEQSGDE